MSITGYRRLTILLSVLTVIAFALAFILFTRSGTLDHKSAMDKLLLYDRLRGSAERGDTPMAAVCLEQVVFIGTFPRSGDFDAFVERERQRTIREIIGVMRTKTGTDLGDDPQKWIERYGR